MRRLTPRVDSLVAQSRACRYAIFNDVLTEGKSAASSSTTPPSLKDVTAFFRNVFTKGQLETECVIMTLICECGIAQTLAMRVTTVPRSQTLSV